MFKQFGLKDFKCHEGDKNFDLPGLTVVSGTNNSGKSSLLQAIYLLTQNRSNRYPVLSLNEEVKLGGFSDILNKKASNVEPIEFSVELDESVLSTGEMKYLHMSFAYKKPSTFEALSIYDIQDYPILNSIEISYETQSEDFKTLTFELMDKPNDYIYKVTGDTDSGFCYMAGIIPEQIIYIDEALNDRQMCSKEYEEIRYYLSLISKENIHYLKAFRLNDFIDKNNSVNRDLGLSGEYTAELIHNKWDRKVDFKYEGKDISFGQLFDEWIKKLLGEDYKVSSESLDRGKFKVVVEEQSSGLELTLDQVGFGISQLLPIITLILTSKSNDIILIENPEVHLHPRLQSMFTDLCIYALQNNRKLIVETHSEHIINRLRMCIKQNHDLLKSINVLFFEKKKGTVRYTDIQITKHGKLAYWPEGFFDQSYHDLLGLIDE
ncbi:DUF3696 domain-containing protein [Bacillus cereus group sp. N18]|uniref:DUF3696 domain-containing protein n=1 Tax=unclassified Bacillus cereus group TaxID=2750818 RepID=UPI000872E13A|nr:MULTISPECIES: DUF3696 domain-containing protein [unclassified Bacillus cereus group]OFC92755.1 hypothetical protein BTGOE5_53790 [Bacillus thuringiensis]HDR7323221.1 DUF3696 domain-containing protein [Bacillus toyonensis]MBJ8050161.1 DUF3696 domain-containing protein [Bacillus cereus group sp. N18]OFD01777.1 hypothetical protein BTGOE7_55460 [Bacillus thuringiensis]HDR7440463.1 DUF3696 domain-containing protein [Bacillus toyonensis]